MSCSIFTVVARLRGPPILGPDTASTIVETVSTHSAIQLNLTTPHHGIEPSALVCHLIMASQPLPAPYDAFRCRASQGLTGDRLGPAVVVCVDGGAGGLRGLHGRPASQLHGCGGQLGTSGYYPLTCMKRMVAQDRGLWVWVWVWGLASGRYEW